MAWKTRENRRCYMRRYRAAHRDHLNALGRRHYRRHRTAVRARHRAYYWRNPTPHNQRSHRTYKRNPALVHSRSDAYWAKHPLRKRLFIVLCGIRARCRNLSIPSYRYYGGRGIECRITLDDLVALWRRDTAHRLLAPSIDRIDPQGHYELANCQFIEHVANARKSHADRLRLRQAK